MVRENVLSRFFRTCDRRSFLKACGAFGLGAVGGGVLQAVFEVVKIDRGLFKVTQTRLAMGTFVTITALHESRGRAEEAVGRAFDEIERLITIFSRHDSRTPLSLLNDEGVLVDPPVELLDLMRRSLDFYRLSSGAFDVTVKPLVDLLQTKGVDGVIRQGDDINAALESVGSHMIEIEPGLLRFTRPGMGVTVDGIAKGHIVDCASRTLAAYGVDNHLVNAGGDIRTQGHPSKRGVWRVAVQDPEKRGNHPAMLRLTNAAVATSGSYEVFFDRERVFHHIVDPRTGASPHHSTSVTIVAPSVTEADALSTAVFVLKPEEGVRFVDGLPRSECLILCEDGRRFESGRWRVFAEQEG